MVFLFFKNGGMNMSVELRNLKGTRDFMPLEQQVKNDIIKKLQEIFKVYGYTPLETPILAYYDILASKYAGGAEILKEIYKFKDQGQRDIALRYDLTVPFARVVGMNPELRLPFKRYEIGKVFRNGPVKTGRMREFIQCDVDIVGVKSVLAEAELMVMAKDAYEMLGLDVSISYNNRKLLSGLVRLAEVEEIMESSVILSLDKIEKIGEQNVRLELKEKGISEKAINQLFRWLNMENTQLFERLRNVKYNPLIEQGIQELDELISYAESIGMEDMLKFNPWLARGLEIYTGTVFEVFLKDGSITSSIGSGGRYDHIIGAFLGKENEYPAVGMSFGLDVIFTALATKRSEEQIAPVQVFLIPIGTEKESMKVLHLLRANGIAADMAMDKKKVRKSLEYANKLNIPYVLMIGEDELSKGGYKLRDMKTGNESELDIARLIDFFGSI